MLPINHMVAVDVSLFREQPDVVRELYELLLKSKELATPAREGAPDLTPFGIEANRRSLEVLIRYSFEQGLIPRLYAVDQLFEEFTQLFQL